MTPLCVDLYCGLGGWAEGFLSAGYRVLGFDVERHDYGTGGYPGQLVLQDVTTLHGSQFKDAAVIVASPPCQRYSYMAMPWSKAKALIKYYEASEERRAELNLLFDTCFRLQREASEAAGRYIPLIVENVRGAQRWVGRAKWHFGSYYLWGDVPALMPITLKAEKFNPDGTEHGPGSWFAIADSKERGAKTPEGNYGPVLWKDREVARYAHPTPEEAEKQGFKVPGFRFDGSGRSFHPESVKVASERGRRTDVGKGARFTSRDCGIESHPDLCDKCGYALQVGHVCVAAAQGYREERKGLSHPDGKGGRDLGGPNDPRRFSSKSNSRKAASAQIAKIPFPLASHIARCFKPDMLNSAHEASRPVRPSLHG